MNLYGQIMNLPEAGGLSETGTTQGEQLAYKRGHRDARDAAAELALEADACIHALLAALQAIIDLDDGDSPEMWHMYDELDAACAVLAKVQGAPL